MSSQPEGTHIRFDEGYQEWQLVDDETHEILLVATSRVTLDEGIELEFGDYEEDDDE